MLLALTQHYILLLLLPAMDRPAENCRETGCEHFCKRDTAVICFLPARQRREGCLDQHFPEICQWTWLGLQSMPFPRRLGPERTEGGGGGDSICQRHIQDRSAPTKTIDINMNILINQGRNTFDTVLPNRHAWSQAQSALRCLASRLQGG